MLLTVFRLLIRASMEQSKLRIGWNGSSLPLPLLYTEFAGLVTKYWLRHTWHFMDAYQMRIEDARPDFLSCRANDQLLIPLFFEQGIRGPQLHRIHLCHLFLPVFKLSDITTGSRTKIPDCMERGTQHDTDVLLLMAHTRPTNRPGLGTLRTSLTTVLRLQTSLWLTTHSGRSSVNGLVYFHWALVTEI